MGDGDGSHTSSHDRRRRGTNSGSAFFAEDVRQDLFGLTAIAPSPTVSLHGYPRKNIQSISCPRPDGDLDFGQGSTRLRCNKHSLTRADSDRPASSPASSNPQDLSSPTIRGNTDTTLL